MTNDDYKAALEATRALFENLKIENKRLVNQNKRFMGALEYYADKKHMRDIVLLDCGALAMRELKNHPINT